MNAVKIYENAKRKLEHNEITLGEFEKMIKPLEDVVEVKHGEWERSKAEIYAYDSEFGELYEYVIPCSCCGETHTIDCSEIPNELPNFCPNCGADMRERKETE